MKIFYHDKKFSIKRRKARAGTQTCCYTFAYLGRQNNGYPLFWEIRPRPPRRSLFCKAQAAQLEEVRNLNNAEYRKLTDK